jgi:hypothetical protein
MNPGSFKKNQVKKFMDFISGCKVQQINVYHKPLFYEFFHMITGSSQGRKRLPGIKVSLCPDT